MPQLFDVKLQASDPEFTALRDQPWFQTHRDRLELMWLAFQPYADTNFRTEFASRCHERFWEMYLGCTLLELGFSLRSSPAGPDFFMKCGGAEVAVEAIAPGPGSGLNGPRLPEPGQGAFISLERIIVRLRSGIEEKHRKHQQYIRKGHVQATQPYIIALSGRNIPLSGFAPGPPLILQAVFPIGEPTFVFTPGQNDDRLVYPFRPHVKKASGASVSTTVFVDPKYAGISAVIFATADAANLPYEFGTDFILIHNPSATHRLPHELLCRGLEFWEENGAVVRRDWNAA